MFDSSSIFTRPWRFVKINSDFIFLRKYDQGSIQALFSLHLDFSCESALILFSKKIWLGLDSGPITTGAWLFMCQRWFYFSEKNVIGAWLKPYFLRKVRKVFYSVIMINVLKFWTLFHPFLAYILLFVQLFLKILSGTANRSSLIWVYTVCIFNFVRHWYSKF